LHSFPERLRLPGSSPVLSCMIPVVISDVGRGRLSPPAAGLGRPALQAACDSNRARPHHAAAAGLRHPPDRSSRRGRRNSQENS
jgi:hypothetical protein